MTTSLSVLVTNWPSLDGGNSKYRCSEVTFNELDAIDRYLAGQNVTLDSLARNAGKGISNPSNIFAQLEA